MKKIIMVLLMSSVRFATAQDSWQMVVHLSEPGKLFTLNVDIGRAAITVTGYNGNDVIVGVETDGRESAQVTSREKNNEVTIDAKPGKAIRLDIKVPQTAGIFKLSSVNGGTIMVSNVTGNLELQNKSGGISALNISGSVIAGTLSGRVTVSFKKVDPTAAMAFSTLSGGIDLAFPAGFKANLKIKSDHGKILSDFRLVSNPAHPQTLQADRAGFYYSPTDDWLYGRVGVGGPEILIKNTSGNIFIRRFP